MINLLPIAKVTAATRLSRASLYSRIQAGLMVRPVKVGPKLSAWPEHEIERINAATVAGKSVDEVRQLVATLHEQRERIAA